MAHVNAKSINIMIKSIILHIEFLIDPNVNPLIWEISFTSKLNPSLNF